MTRKYAFLAVALIGTVGVMQLCWGQDVGGPTANNGQVLGDDLADPLRARLGTRVSPNVGELIQKLTKETDVSNKFELEKEIKATLGKQFDVRQATREQELKALEQKVKELRELFEKRQQAKGDIVENRFQQLLRAANGLDWGEGGETGSGGGPLGSFRLDRYNTPSQPPK